MSTSLDSGWFTEVFDSQGSAFSLKVTGKLHDVQSDYQHLEVYATETFGNLMVLDGCVMLTDRDNFLYHEMIAHPALFTHADPKRVVIIGGGDCGTLREVLRHPGVERVTQIDIDEEVTRAAERFFPALTESNDDPRAELAFIDGVRWVDEAEAESVDVLIIDSTDPVGPAEGLFTTDFLRRCHRLLRSGGVMVQQSESPLYHSGSIIHSLRRDMREAGFDSVATLPFPQPVYPSGWWSVTLAGKGREVNDFREQDAREAGLPLDYYTADIHRGALALPPFMRRALD
ncbi:polyamine aminopropyltransferase [Halomonas elongata]|uniref:Polyamine aminopropyltransferase n=1 Tax=Halomonas elongata (strain ATCC 33173 / DSM 2581 / NBRC 15536 / NCIMB 2198 / 1H9) TaxID=768066 RepID=E1V4D6_HALED|nr:polyamine aminopropyltransferase [Halomonas elongata]MBW5800411.1 polyamine aminopropyltransferase [Halomonas elongata]MDL4860983.1 polyamine aminopropyltransferase [Halomonas elongata]WBF19936.1 polyamine aminopropyltransferase [Halomonas elongata]WPU49235.1 polyamine aminopropyltransferase [Halomonas elongata DSM 2581]WVI73346.1 polyamine aminopropyltransferase [Halomonas elongata]